MIAYRINGRPVSEKDYEKWRKGRHQRMGYANAAECIQDMVASGMAPGCGITDDVLMSGIGSLEDQYKGDPDALDRLVTAARKNGYVPKPTDYYMPSLARFKGDPAAFVNHGQGVGHIRKVMEERGWESEGVVTTKAREPEVDPHTLDHTLNPRIVEAERLMRIAENPDLARRDQDELRAEIVQDHGAKE